MHNEFPVVNFFRRDKYWWMDKHDNKESLGGPVWEPGDQERPRKLGIFIDNNSNNSNDNKEWPYNRKKVNEECKNKWRQ